ncbi:MAG: RDD family protein [Phycisphaerae bacterium]|nr:RDD family protein [Phycisphaerae bacterium]
MMRIRLIATVCLVLALGASAPAWGKEWQAARLWVTGGEENVWIVGASEPVDEGLGVIQIWYSGKGDTKTTVSDGRVTPRQSPNLPPVSGDLFCVGADTEALRVLFSDLSACDYSANRKSTLGALWRDQCGEKPLAWGGDSSEATFWALVETTALVTKKVKDAKGSRDTAGGDDAGAPARGGDVEAADETKTTDHGESRKGRKSGERREAPVNAGEIGTAPKGAIPAGRLTLLRLRDGAWCRLPVLGAASQGRRFWLSGHGGVLHLFWQVPAEGVLVATLASEVWSEPQLVTSETHVQAGWAGARAEGPVFVAGTGDSTDHVQLRLLLRRDGTWSDEGLARDGTEALSINPVACGVGVVGGQLGVARPTESGQVEFGLGDLGASPSIRFTTLRLGSVEPEEQPIWQEMVLLAVLMVLVTGLFWSRRQQVAQPAKVPDGLVIAPIFHRLLATIIDYLPAIAVTSLLSLPVLMGHMGGLPETTSLTAWLEHTDDPELQEALLPYTFGSIALYGLWCLIWELSRGTTPGKMLFRCRVVSSDGAPPTAKQIILRNVARVVVFALGPPGLVMTFMTMLLLTRNRQRIGDVLANTIVVGPGVARPVDAGSQEHDRPSGPTE